VAEYRFVREVRTPYSEAYSVEDDEHSLGRVDVHFTSSAAHAILAVHAAVTDEIVQELIAAIDDQIVTPADPYREDLVVTVWRGEEVGTFADDTGDEDEFDEEDEEDLDEDER
jgi:hypothetical protein